jgi:hypothetical protein
MAENRIEDPEEIKNFDGLGYRYRDDLSSATELIFERQKYCHARKNNSIVC